MKIYISHPSSNTIKLNDEQPVVIEGISQIPDASCVKIQLGNVLDYISEKERDRILLTAISKLRIEGELHLNGVDFFAVGTFISSGLITIDEVNKVVLNGRMSMDCIRLLQEKLSRSGLEIVKANMDGFSYSIIIKRNPNE